VAIGEDGYTQMGLEDIACLRSLPNIPIIQPADELETKQAVAYAVEHPGPLYLRLTRQNLEPVHDAAYRFRFGKADVLRPGHDVTLLTTGGPVWNTLEAAKKLAAEGIQAEVINIATIKPLDEPAILRSAGRTGHVVTVEDHSIRRPGQRGRGAARRGDAADEADRGDDLGESGDYRALSPRPRR
jgi:transketolase